MHICLTIVCRVKPEATRQIHIRFHYQDKEFPRVAIETFYVNVLC